MSKDGARRPPSAIDAVNSLREGSIDLVAECIEHGGGDMLFMCMTADDRTRLARALRTGSPLTRSEKRENRVVCSIRDLFLIHRLFYWFGSGYPGFSHTGSETAFHKAIDDYQQHLIKGAPVRTVESLYRHVWKPYLQRLKENRLTAEDQGGCNQPPLSSFLTGLIHSHPQSNEEVIDRLSWFQNTLVTPEAKFFVSAEDKRLLQKICEITGYPFESWVVHLTEKTGQISKTHLLSK